VDPSSRQSQAQPGEFADSYATFQIVFGLVMLAIFIVGFFVFAISHAR
jgi:hypothetical protein